MNVRRTVLIVAYGFPPLGGGGVQRTVKFVKYLPEHGWDPVVLTTGARVYHAEDDTLRGDLPPGLRVVRAPEVLIARRAAAAAARLRIPHAQQLAGWPDREMGWIPGAVRAGLRAVRRDRPDVIYSTSPPASGHLVALALHRYTGLPWVADFRDPWAHTALNRRTPGLGVANRWAERTVTRRASRVLVSAEFAPITGTLPGEQKRVFIPNGVDADDLVDRAAVPNGRFTLTFVGSLYRSIDCAPVLAALRRLAERGAVKPDELELRIVGNIGVRELDAGPFAVTRVGYVDHARAVREMADADALLCYVPSAAPQNTPGKIYEYLASNRPVLCVTSPDNFAFRLVGELGAGACAAPEDGRGIEAALEDMVSRWRGGRLAPTAVRAQVLARFSRRHLTGELATVLDEATGSDRPSGIAAPLAEAA
jgi:glycosyltransferase involved in cell wall biosynthesis